MNMKNTTCVVLHSALLLLTVTALAQSSVPLGARLKLRWNAPVVHLIDSGHAHDVSIQGQYNAAGIDTVKLQSAKEAGGFIYLLLDVTGPSKIPVDNHQCGAGTESNLVWLKLDQAWKLLESRSFLYESCWSTVSPADAPRWQGDTLKVEADIVRDAKAVTVVATYSFKRPEEGIQLVEAPTGK